MIRKVFSILMLAALVLGLPSAAVHAGTAVSAQPAVKAIGALPTSGVHLVPPREDVALSVLRSQGKIPLHATEAQVQAAVKGYYKQLGKKSQEWADPALEAKALQHEKDLKTSGISAQTDQPPAVQPVSVQILALAVDFSATANDSITRTITTGVDSQGNPICSAPQQQTGLNGPRQGNIPAPGPKDNNTVWYTNAQTVNPDFYKKLVFGTDGVGRVRMDLTDPVDGKPGVNLAGYTVQDYYDHVAGKGNVNLTGDVEGWVTVDHSEMYYGASDCANGYDDGGAAVDVAQLVVDTVAKFSAVHPQNDAWWKQYDANDDGLIDTFWLIHAGMGQEAGGGAQGDDAIWSHSSDTRYTVGRVLVYQAQTAGEHDIYVGPYTMQPENADMGVFAEEFGHNVFGLPDLYTTDTDNSVGFWSIMAAGAWGGPLGGAAPVGMPLWFRMIAQCGSDFCNWQYPMKEMDYADLKGDVTIGQLENTPDGVDKGVRIDLPDAVQTIANPLTDPADPDVANTTKAAWSGTGNEMVKTLDRTITVTDNTLSFDSSWDIENGYDYAYVMIQDGTTWTDLADEDGFFKPDAQSNPSLTGSHDTVSLKFDLTPYTGKSVTLRFAYVTDPGVNGQGWFIDNVRLGSTLVEAFESGSGADFGSSWTNSDPGWEIIPSTKTFTNYYLVEWRNNTKYDQMVKTAYVTTYSDADEWQVERVPYNIPGALVYYRNARYNSSYSLDSSMYDEPSFGPKYQLLVVDANPGAMRFYNAGDPQPYTFGTRVASYDAALTLNPAKAFTLSQVSTTDGPIAGPHKYAAVPAVTTFDDFYGYYPGLFYNPSWDPNTLNTWNYPGSAVIPAASLYSTRITDADGAPLTNLYGSSFGPSWLGTGNPGDDGVDQGVAIKLVSQAKDGSTATLHFPAMTSTTTYTKQKVSGGYLFTFTTVVLNDRPRPVDYAYYEVDLDQPMDFVSFTSSTAAISQSAQPIKPQKNFQSGVAFVLSNIPVNTAMTLTLKMKYTGSLPQTLDGIVYMQGDWGNVADYTGGTISDVYSLSHGTVTQFAENIFESLFPFIAH
jgi:immune inhibitor A